MGRHQPSAPEDRFDGLRAKAVENLEAQDPLYVVDAFAGADPQHRIGVRVITGSPYHALFAKTMFITPTAHEARSLVADVVVLHAPAVEADPAVDGTGSGTFVVLHPSKGEVLIGGTFYGGEIKKSIFTVMNDRLPLEGVLPMHCSANVGEDGKVAIFFGLSGTGKTTLSADPERSLIGDDEHGWGAHGVFNIEGGCYAKVIRLSAEAEPEIFQTTKTFGTVLENVAVDDRGVIDLDDDSRTENTRAAYKLERISNALPDEDGRPSARGRDADRRRLRDPPADREALARPGPLLLPLRFHREARGNRDRGAGAAADVLDLLRRSLPAATAGGLRAAARREARSSRATVWLVNTGWTGGPYGQGHRMPIQATRRLLHAALQGELDEVDYRVDDVFGFELPARVPGVDPALLVPRSTWRDPEAYDEKARELAAMFAENFEKFAADAGAAVAQAGPRVP